MASLSCGTESSVSKLSVNLSSNSLIKYHVLKLPIRQGEEDLISIRYD